VRLQLLSDLHLETETFEPAPAAGAEALVLAGDIDSTWRGYRLFAGWPVPVLVVAGNHEYDGRDFDEAQAGLRALCAELGFSFLEREALIVKGQGGERIRFLATTRWSDFDLFGPERRPRAERAAEYFMRLMGSTRRGQPFDVAAVRDEALACRAWLESELSKAPQGRWDCTLVVTRYVKQPGTASFCNDDDDLIPRADVWLHGHLHCRHDYLQPRAGRAPARVVCNARGLAAKGEDEGFDALLTLSV
jgi:hypothetical protein